PVQVPTPALPSCRGASSHTARIWPERSCLLSTVARRLVRSQRFSPVTVEFSRLPARDPACVVRMANTDGKRRAKKKQRRAAEARDEFEQPFDPGTALEVLHGATVLIEALSQAAV